MASRETIEIYEFTLAHFLFSITAGVAGIMVLVLLSVCPILLKTH